MIKGVKLKSELQEQLKFLFDASEPWGLEYNFLKIKIILKELDTIISNKIIEVENDIKGEGDVDIMRSMSTQPNVFFYKNDYQDTFRKALFTSLYSFFEIGLKEIISIINNIKKFGNADDVVGIGRILNTAGLIEYNNDWDNILKLASIRNVIVHHDSFVPEIEKYKNLHSCLVRNKISSIDYNGYIRITGSEFIHTSIDKFRKVYNTIYFNSEKFKS